MIDRSAWTALAIVIAPLVLGIDGKLKQPSQRSRWWLCWVMPALTVSYVRYIASAKHT